MTTNLCRHCQGSDPLGLVEEADRADQVEIARIQADSALQLELEAHRHAERMAGIEQPIVEAQIEASQEVAEHEASEAAVAVEAVAEAVEGAAEAEADGEAAAAEADAEAAIAELDDNVEVPAPEGESEEKPKSMAARWLS